MQLTAPFLEMQAGSSGWYQDAHLALGLPMYFQTNALMAFWPGLQVLAGDLRAAESSFDRFMSVWERHGMLPENYQWRAGQVHPTDNGKEGGRLLGLQKPLEAAPLGSAPETGPAP